MRHRIDPEMRRFVAERAERCCEYCRVPEVDFLIEFHVDHIRSIKHGGTTVPENLAYACSDCNAHKGTDLSTFLDNDAVFTRFFNPRTDLWSEHFETSEGVVYAQTPIGAATIKIFQINEIDRVIIRQELARDGRYPS